MSAPTDRWTVAGTSAFAHAASTEILRYLFLSAISPIARPRPGPVAPTSAACANASAVSRAMPKLPSWSDSATSSEVWPMSDSS